MTDTYTYYPWSPYPMWLYQRFCPCCGRPIYDAQPYPWPYTITTTAGSTRQPSVTPDAKPASAGEGPLL